MLALQYESPKEGLKLCKIPIPEPGPGSVQIRVKAAGLCYSDCHLVKGHDGVLVRKPITLGHEVSGIITAIGPSVVGYRAGDRVAVSLLAYPLNMDAEYAVAPVNRLVRIPDGVLFSQAAVATDATATAYHAVMIEAGVCPGATVGIVGIGGLGMQGLRFAALKGATVYGIDIVDSKFARAKQLGARGCFKSLKEVGDIAFDVIVDFVGAKEITRSALERVKEGGKVVLVGLAAGNVTISSTDLVTRSITLIGSLGASEADLKDVLELLSRKEIDPELEEIPFSDIPAGLNALDIGKAQGRLWTDPSKPRKRFSQL
ncbi:alcohol dehydrogenase GroES-like domain-containing protein [Colletotrichum navitas]|uniref:Alcohol dehydrogenase GroES-like domain-containing protein n=1 Tax=Colletotrichum navitas TaxID=681940 RepID=A0AAD8PTY1_9PEZI|nr:alcohol dehydrogenase GroES-like domain-containing protein [Colletotrichum navitas]KAK1580034.1 alcohol dehydrogenase GroES-like domain-containing protein [Colletotrichum navitas]